MVQKIHENRWFTLSIVLLLLFVGLLLRFYQAESNISFGWDQARDSWMVREIIQGKLLMQGPKTGIGNLHLGPLYFYFLVPFYIATNLDPVGSIYFTMLVYILTYASLYYVTKHIFSERIALFTLFLYTVSTYLSTSARYVWNVSLVPATAMLIIYSLFKIRTGHYKWFVVLGALSGFFYHLHFSALFIPLIVLCSLVFIKPKKAMIPWIILGFFLCLLFLLPTVVSELLSSSGEKQRIVNFSTDYVHRPNFQFMLYRLPDSLFMFEALLYFKPLSYLKFVLPIIFAIIIFFFEKDKDKKHLGFILLPWFIIPLIGFTAYKGPISDYYFLLNLPAALFILIYLQDRLIQINKKVFVIILLGFWSFYSYHNIGNHIAKTGDGGLAKQKNDVRETIKNKGSIPYHEGDIKAYLYTIWTDKN